MTESRTIVVGYDGSAAATHAVQWAAQQASLRGCRLHVVHSSLWPLLTNDLGPVPGVADSGLERSAQITLEEGLAHARHAAPAVEIETTLTYGRPSQHLARVSAGKEMLVVGSRGIGGFLGLLVGSVSLELAATAACPVAVIRPGGNQDGQVVVAVGRSGSPAAMQDACTMALATQSALSVVHVRNTPAGYRRGRDSVDAEAAAERVLDTAVRTARTLAPKVPVDGKVITDSSIPRAILNASKSASIIVVGTRGHGIVREAIGSTAHAVLHHAHGPVLISRRGSPAAPPA